MSNNRAWGQNPNYAAPNQGFYNPPVRPVGNGLAVGGFVVSILGLGFLLPLFGLIVAPLVLLALALSIFGLIKANGGAPRRGLAIAGIAIAGLTLLAGTTFNILLHRNATEQWTTVATDLPAPTGAQAEALVGDWAWMGDDEVEAPPSGTPWFRFNADGTGENLVDGERFNWHGDGTFTNASSYRDWHVDGDTLTVTWITGVSFEYSRVR